MSIKLITIKSIEILTSSNEKFTVCSVPSLMNETYENVIEIAREICNTLSLMDNRKVIISMLTSNGTYSVEMNFDLISIKTWNITEENLLTL